MPYIIHIRILAVAKAKKKLHKKTIADKMNAEREEERQKKIAAGEEVEELVGCCFGACVLLCVLLCALTLALCVDLGWTLLPIS